MLTNFAYVLFTLYFTKAIGDTGSTDKATTILFERQVQEYHLLHEYRLKNLSLTSVTQHLLKA